MREGKRDTAAALPPLRYDNVCIPGIFADGRMETPGDNLILP
jgi:hypothetical protein